MGNYAVIETKDELLLPTESKIQAAVAFLGAYNYYYFHSIWNLSVNLPMNFLALSLPAWMSSEFIISILFPALFVENLLYFLVKELILNYNSSFINKFRKNKLLLGIKPQILYY